MTLHRLVVIDDEPSIQLALKEFLEDEGFEVLQAFSLKEADALPIESASVVLLDWRLKDGDGVDFLKKMRQQKIDIPTIMLTAKTDTIDKVVGLETGADDYMTKPFVPRELLARIRVQLRKKVVNSRDQEKDVISVNGIELHVNSREAFFNKQSLDLTKVEFDLLKFFMEHPERVFSRDELLNHVWGYDKYPMTRTVDNHVLLLRQKTSDEFFETMRSVGYKFVQKGKK